MAGRKESSLLLQLFFAISHGRTPCSPCASQPNPEALIHLNSDFEPPTLNRALKEPLVAKHRTQLMRPGSACFWTAEVEVQPFKFRWEAAAADVAMALQKAMAERARS